VIACAVDMQRSPINRLRSLPAKKTSFVEPMECLSVPRLPEGSQWLREIKLAGYRALAVTTPAGKQMYSWCRY
jgi:ATP-dependent DNA ligase